MEIKELQNRIEKKNAQIEKIQRRVQKWNKNLTAEDEQAAMSSTWRELRDYCKAHNYDWDKSNQLEEYHRALGDLEDAVTTLNKYKNNLALEEAKAGAPRVEAIMNFLLQWKKDVAEFVRDNAQVKVEYGQVDHERCELFNYRYSFIREHGEEAWKQRYAELGKKCKRLGALIDPLTDAVSNYRGEISETRLEELLNKEIEAKYWNMVEKVTKITGEITDATHVEVGGDGNLNGFITGDKGTAHLETIVAGGYNEGVIVNVKHGPRRHFRLICNPIKTK